MALSAQELQFQNTAIAAIKEVRKMEDNHYQKSGFCREHGMELDAIKHTAIENELRRVCQILQDKFDTGYVA